MPLGARVVRRRRDGGRDGRCRAPKDRSARGRGGWQDDEMDKTWDKSFDHPCRCVHQESTMCGSEEFGFFPLKLAPLFGQHGPLNGWWC